MLHSYCPEMGEKEPTITTEKQVGHLKILKQEPIEMIASIGHYGGYYLRTKTELKGQGIRFVDSDNGVNHYKLTDRAFEKLEQANEIKMISWLD